MPTPKKPKAITSIADLTPDPQNARKHNPRNIGVIADSLQELGTARSIVVDEDGVILAGNGVVEAAGQVGIEKVHVIDVPGDTIVAVRKTGLTPEQKRDLALRDNRATDLSEWDPAVLKAISEEQDLSHLFSKNELAGIIESEDDEDPQKMSLKAPPKLVWVLVGIPVDDYGDVYPLVAGLEAKAKVSVQTSGPDAPQD